jgi:hypothetical protein
MEDAPLEEHPAPHGAFVIVLELRNHRLPSQEFRNPTAPVWIAQVPLPIGTHGDTEGDEAEGFSRRLPLRTTTRFASTLAI